MEKQSRKNRATDWQLTGCLLLSGRTKFAEGWVIEANSELEAGRYLFVSIFQKKLGGKPIAKSTMVIRGGAI